MAVVARSMVSMRVSPGSTSMGAGYLGGYPAEVPSDPDSPDGLARKLNVPSRVRILVMDRRTLRVVRSTLSKADGTWSVTGLDPEQYYIVFGFDDTHQVNAAIQDWVRPAVRT